MIRREGWEERLLETVAKHEALSGEFGTSDCYLWPMDVVLAMTGEEPWPSVRGKYKTERGAATLLRRHGYKNVEQAFSDKFPEIPPAEAQRGDIGIIDTPEGPAGVVFLGSDIRGKNKEPGLTRLPRLAVRRAFAVGR